MSTEINTIKVSHGDWFAIFEYKNNNETLEIMDELSAKWRGLTDDPMFDSLSSVEFFFIALAIGAFTFCCTNEADITQVVDHFSKNQAFPTIDGLNGFKLVEISPQSAIASSFKIEEMEV